MILNPHTIIDPGTMMVEAFYTPITESAVARSLSSDHFAVRTQTTRVEFLN